MSTIHLPNGRTYDAEYAGDDPGRALFSASLVTSDVVSVVQDFSGAESFTVNDPHTGEHVFEGYTNLSELHLVSGRISVTLRREG